MHGHFIERIFDHTDGQTRRDILQAGAVFLCLLDRAVHKHRAAAAQIDRTICKQAQGSKLLDVIAQCLGKGLQKAAAAGGTSLVQKDIADGAILDLEALHILAADVDDKV